LPNQLANLRDLGGLPLRGGGRTRSGVLYRADASYAGDVAPRQVEHWPPSTVVDLRSDAEVSRWPYTWPEPTTVLLHPLHDGARPDRVPGEHDLARLYAVILDKASHLVARLLGVAAEAPGPVLMHCAAGKDRTGVVVAALLAAAGVERDAIVADYMATTSNLPMLRRRWERQGISTGSDSAVPEAWLEAPAAAIGVVLDRIECRRARSRRTSAPGGQDAWWIDHGVDPASLRRWRDRMRSLCPVQNKAH